MCVRNLENQIHKVKLLCKTLGRSGNNLEKKKKESFKGKKPANFQTEVLVYRNLISLLKMMATQDF